MMETPASTAQGLVLAATRQGWLSCKDALPRIFPCRWSGSGRAGRRRAAAAPASGMPMDPAGEQVDGTAVQGGQHCLLRAVGGGGGDLGGEDTSLAAGD